MLDAERGKLIKGEFDFKENSPTDLRQFFSELKQEGYRWKALQLTEIRRLSGLWQKFGQVDNSAMYRAYPAARIDVVPN